MGTYNGVDDDAIFSNLRAFQIWFEVKNDTFDMHFYVEGNEDDAIKEVVKWTLANGYRWVRILSWHEAKLDANKMEYCFCFSEERTEKNLFKKEDLDM